MKLWKVGMCASAALSLAAIAAPASAGSVTYDWTVSGVGTSGEVGPGTGTITFTTATNGADTVTGITGEISGVGITSLAALGSGVSSSDDMIYPAGTPTIDGTPNVFDTHGLDVNLADGHTLDIYGFYAQGSTISGTPPSNADGFYSTDPAFAGALLVGNFVLTTPVPLSPSWVVMLFGLIGLGAGAVRSTKQGTALRIR